MNISFPSDTKDTIDQIRNAIGRPVGFYYDSPITCSACSLDPVTNTSTNPYCTVCNGEHYIHHYSVITISGHVTWGPSEVLGWSTGGQFYEGDCRVQIEYTPANISVLDTTEYVIVDEHKMSIRKKTFRGVPELNRILIDLMEEE